MNYLPRSIVSIVFSVVLSICSAALFPSETRGQEPDVAARVKQIFRSRCHECHSDEVTNADIKILDLNTFVGSGKAVVPNKPSESVLLNVITAKDEFERMPESPLPPLSASEIQDVRDWIADGAPAFPEDVEQPNSPGEDQAFSEVIGVEYVLDQILNHVDSTPFVDRPFQRYFSANHLLTEGATADELETNRQALAKAINHLSWQRKIVQPTVVDPGVGSIFVVDIRDLGWEKTPFTQQSAARSGPTNLNLFDLVLLEYPYSRVFESSETYDRLFQTYLQPAKLVRPIAYLRADWFVSVATQSPLYDDILQLPHDLSDLEEKLGVDAEHNLMTYKAKRAGMTFSGVSRNNRVVERHPALYGAYWKSYDFETSKGQQNMFADPINFHFAGGEMIWNLPNGLQGYLITDNLGKRIAAAPTSIVTDDFASDKTVRNGLACMRCHDRGMKRFEDKIRPAFQKLADLPGMFKSDVLRLYPEKTKMDALLDEDEQRFMDAMQMALGKKQNIEPLYPTARKYLDAPVTLSTAAGELGLKDTSGLKLIFKLPQFARLGLAGLASGGVLHRDSWEEYYGRVVEQLGVGIPITPIDAATHPDHLAIGPASGLTIATNKRSNVFSPGEEMVITIKNEASNDFYIELVGTSARGRKVALTDGVIKLPAGQSYRYPNKGGIKIQPRLGNELITVFAAATQFAPGTLFRGKDLSDRFVHDFYRYDRDGAGLSERPAELIKKTLKIETR